jgi:response regulator of citrate/malate metabolism
MGAAQQSNKEDFRIFIVEDDYIYNKLATLITEEIVNTYNCPDLNFEVASYLSAEECLRNLHKQPKIVLMDYFFEVDGSNNISTAVDVISKMKRQCNSCEIIMVSSLSELNRIVELIEMGVHHFKDQDSLNRLRFTLRNVMRDLVDKHYLA